MVDQGSELSRFFGRKTELELLRRLFEEERRPVVTLVGASGGGKSRLARELVRDCGLSRILVDLAQATTLEELVASTAAAVGQPLQETRDLERALEQIGMALALRGRVIAIFDRVEQLREPLARALGGWVRAAPEARFVLTSRIRLGLGGAVEVEVDGLPNPDAESLFIDRAQLQRPNWQPSEAERTAIAELVERLGGLPLAIELSAARSNLLDVSEMLAQLERQRSSRTHSDALSQTLFDAIEESWRLLSEQESAAARACSVFAGSFSLDAAEAVLCEIGSALIDVLHGLANKSILRRAAAPGRLGMLEPVRAFAEEQLRRDHELEVLTRNRHAEYFVEVATRARLDHLESADREALDELAAEYGNLSGAFEWCVSEGQAQRAIELALALHTLFWARGPIGLHLAMLERALSVADAAPVESRVDLWLAKSTALGHGVGRSAALAAAESAFETALAGRHLQRQSRALARIARVHASYGEAEPAREKALEALDAAKRAGDPLGEAYAYATIAVALRQLGKLDQARDEIVRALGLLRTVRRPRLELESLELLASIERAQGRTERALAVLEDALAECKRMGDERMIADVSREMGVLHEQMGKPERALEDYERAGAALGHLGCRHEQLGTCLAAAAVRLELGDDPNAPELCERSLELARELDDRSSQAWAAALLGVAEARGDRLGHAERAFELADTLARDGSEGLSEAVTLYRGHYDLALARRAEREASREQAEGIRDAVKQRLAGPLHWSDRVRQAGRMLERSLASAQPVKLAIAPDGSWFRLAGSEPISIANRPTLCRLLSLLAEKRTTDPAVPVTYAAIVANLWPEERILPSAAKSRIHVAISTLRKLGLGDQLRGGTQGYYLDPALALSRQSRPG